MKLVECFMTLQGEGNFTGAPTIFVRFAGCSLRCPECDTKYSYEDSTKALPDVGAPFILDRIVDLCSRPRFICITGGEPLEQPKAEMYNLLNALQTWHRVRGLEAITIETNGAQNIDWLLALPYRRLLNLSVDFKLPSTGRDGKMLFGNFVKLTEQDVIKFVCRDIEDVRCANSVLSELAKQPSCSARMLFHCLGGKAERWLAEAVLDLARKYERFDIRMGVQLHKLAGVR